MLNSKCLIMLLFMGKGEKMRGTKSQRREGQSAIAATGSFSKCIQHPGVGQRRARDKKSVEDCSLDNEE